MSFQKILLITNKAHLYPNNEKKIALKCYIDPILLYECENWTISKQLV